MSRRYGGDERLLQARARYQARRELKMERARKQNADTAARKAAGLPAPEHFKASKRARGLVK